MQTKVLIIFSIMLPIATVIFSQTNPLSKWKVDKKNYFLYQKYISSNQNDTIIFTGIASFHSDLVNIDSVDKITYIIKTKKIIFCGSKKGTIKLSDKIFKKMLTPITEISDSYPIDTIEYIIGGKTVYFKMKY